MNEELNKQRNISSGFETRLSIVTGAQFEALCHLCQIRDINYCLRQRSEEQTEVETALETVNRMSAKEYDGMAITLLQSERDRKTNKIRKIDVI